MYSVDGNGQDEDDGEDDTELQLRLDRIEMQVDLWCNLVGSADRLNVQVHDGHVRENVLEALFDLTSEHVKEVYLSIDRDGDGRIEEKELAEGLEKCGIKNLAPMALQKVWKLMTDSDKKGRLQMAEFESILS